MTCASYPNICIVQGQTYRQSFSAEGNWTGAECRGQIRDNWLNSDGAIKALFEFGALTYDAEADLTTVEGVISHQQTTALPATKYQGTGIQSVKNSLVYDVEIELEGSVYKLAPGYVQVVPEVSDDSVIYDPPVIWNGGIDSVELTETTGLVDTYTIWGDADKTINLGSFDVANGVGVESADYAPLTGILTFTFTDGSELETGDLRADLDAETIKTRYESNDDTNAFTDAEKSKLEGINISLYAPKTNAVFTGSLILPNNSQINGVEHFYQNTKPTVRGDGSALVIGDRWWKVDNGTEWFWNGTYWLGRQKEILRSGTTNVTAGVLSLSGVPLIQEQALNIFAASLSAIIRFPPTGTFNNSNYWRIGSAFETNLATGASNGTFPNPIIYHNVDELLPPFKEYITTLGVFLNSNAQLANLRLWTTVVGSPSAATWVGGRFIYHEVYL